MGWVGVGVESTCADEGGTSGGEGRAGGRSLGSPNVQSWRRHCSTLWPCPCLAIRECRVQRVQGGRGRERKWVTTLSVMGSVSDTHTPHAPPPPLPSLHARPPATAATTVKSPPQLFAVNPLSIPPNAHAHTHTALPSTHVPPRSQHLSASQLSSFPSFLFSPGEWKSCNSNLLGIRGDHKKHKRWGHKKGIQEESKCPSRESQ